MFPGDSGIELESGFLRSRSRFRSAKKRKIFLGRGSCSTNNEEDGYKLASYLDKRPCDEEEEYRPISEGDEELEESTKVPEREVVTTCLQHCILRQR